MDQVLTAFAQKILSALLDDPDLIRAKPRDVELAIRQTGCAVFTTYRGLSVQYALYVTPPGRLCCTAQHNNAGSCNMIPFNTVFALCVRRRVCLFTVTRSSESPAADQTNGRVCWRRT
jgi:hypothetical protein